MIVEKKWLFRNPKNIHGVNLHNWWFVQFVVCWSFRFFPNKKHLFGLNRQKGVLKLWFLQGIISFSLFLKQYFFPIFKFLLNKFQKNVKKNY